MKKAAVFMLMVLMLAAGCSFKAKPDNYIARGTSPGDKMARKFSRGMTNIITSPLEMVNQPVDQAMKGDGPMEELGGYIGGLFIGVVYTAGRIVCGATEVVTSPIYGIETNGMEDPFVHSVFLNQKEPDLMTLEDQEFAALFNGEF